MTSEETESSGWRAFAVVKVAAPLKRSRLVWLSSSLTRPRVPCSFQVAQSILIEQIADALSSSLCQSRMAFMSFGQQAMMGKVWWCSGGTHTTVASSTAAATSTSSYGTLVDGEDPSS
eukprot:2351164-Amphidinium_carterae.1